MKLHIHFAALAFVLAANAHAAPLINEIMYRPGSTYPENTALEFIEIYNPDATAVNIGGWALTTGVDYVFPAGTSIAAGDYLVVASNPTALGVPGALGPWEAGDALSNRGEDITFAQPDGSGGWTTIDSVTYADEGDWATSRTFDTTNGHQWITGAVSGGKSLERRNPALASGNGQNFGESNAVGGSPGAQNSLLVSNIAPVIKNLKHTPAVPRATESVIISCEIEDETPVAGLTVTLFYRNATTASPPAFSSVAMTGNAAGIFTATLPPSADKTIIEFYLSATDGILSRTWPAAVTGQGQVANCQLQFDNEVVTGRAPAYRIIMTENERVAYNAVAAASNRMFNTTFVATRGEDTTIRYRAYIRNRGQTSRNWTYRPIRMSLPTDDRWDDVTDFAINPKYPYCQFMGMRSMQAAGLPAGDSTPVELRLNGVERSVTGVTGDYGKWVRIEDVGGEYVDNHWPLAVDGQVYRAESMTSYWISTGATPTVPTTLWNGWSKQNHSHANDWTDVQTFSTQWQNLAGLRFTGHTAGNVQSGTWNNTAFTDAEVTTLSDYCDFDHMARYMAVFTIIQNSEASIDNGGSDDYAAAWIEDAAGKRRLNLIPHDCDNVLGKGDTAAVFNATGIYSMTETGMIFEPLLPLFGNTANAGNAAFRTKYLTAIRELYGSVFDADTAGNPYPPFYAFIDNHLSDWLDATVRSQLKTFATQRQAYILGLIGQPKITPAAGTSTATVFSAPPSGVRINEVLAVQAATYLNGTTYPDVIELHNSSASAVSLADMSLSDDPATARKYVFPAGTSIPAGGYLLVFADSVTAAPGLHTNFGLDADGDQIRLYDTVAAGGGLIDSILFGPQLSDKSISRTGAGADTWALTAPTVNAANGSPLTLGSVAGVKINEWAGNKDFRLNEDFAELYNPAALPVALGGLRITDSWVNYPSRYVMPQLSFIEATGFMVREGDELGFGINSNFDQIFLLGQNGAIMDAVSVISQFSDVSTGRSTDGGANWTNLDVPTPNLSNTYTNANSTALLNFLRVTEIMYQPTGGGNFEWVELQNISTTTTLDLSNVRFTSGIDYTFASGAMLAPGAFTVVCRSRTDFLNRYPSASASLAAGAFTGALDNSGETLALTLPFPHNVNIARFRYEPTWYPTTAGGGYSLATANQSQSLAKDWDESFTWQASSVVNGTPGTDGPPAITSATTASGIVGEAFSYQILATKLPTSYGATGFPAWLNVNTTSGLLSGTPTAAGTFSGTISATNAGGTASQGLTINIATSGPLHHFTFEYTPASANANTAFPLHLRARDSAERIVTAHSASTTLSAASISAYTGSPIAITEVWDGTEAQIELQNVTDSTVDTAGWYVKINDSTANINTVNAAQRALPASMTAGQIAWVSETNVAPRLWWGGPIAWTTMNSRGWVMLFDSTDTLRDFFLFGWTSANLGTLNVTINGTNITSANVGWTGNGNVAGTRGTADSWARIGTSDTNQPANFVWRQNSANFNSTNVGLTLPWVNSSALPVTPTALTFATGEYLGYNTISTTAATVRLTATSTTFTGLSTTFPVLAALADTDSDGMPDSWETANGLSVGVNDAALDADGDGSTNRQEYLAGTNPQDANSRLFVGGLSYNNPALLQLTWDALAGKLYRASTSPDLQTWSFLPGSLRLPTTNGPQTLSIDPAGAPHLFLRIEIAP